MRLYVNIDHVATLREVRQTDEPDPVPAADVAERAGADGITVHLREDRRHIQDADVRALKAAVRGGLNLELGAHDEIVRIACRVKPFQATLVPERRQEITTEGGLALHGPGRHGPGRRGPNRHGPNRKVGAAVRRLMDAGIRVSLFIDPDLATIDRAAELGVPAIELHTGRYAHTWRRGDAALRALARAAAHARQRGLAVHAGHGLTYQTAQPLGMSDFFALEAGEYLERLDGLLAQGDHASADELVRLARALRGSALMANQPAIARAAAGLESLARAVRESRRTWDPPAKQLAVRAVDDLKIFVRRAGSWTEADTAKAEALGQELDLLDGIERTIAELSRSGLKPPAHIAELFQTATTAIARAAREVAERGRPDPDAAEFRRFAELLVRSMESEPDVVSIGSLYYNDSGPHLVSRGVPAARPSTLGRLELVSHGEHLRQAADSLERAPSATQRELRAHTLGSTFRAVATAGGGTLADRIAE